MNLKSSLGNLDPTVGIAAANKSNFDKMKNWPDSPFLKYQCNRKGTRFVIVKKHQKTKCAGEHCVGRANKNCSHNMEVLYHGGACHCMQGEGLYSH